MDKNEAVVRVVTIIGDGDFTRATSILGKYLVVIPKMLISFPLMTSFPQSRHQYRYPHILMINLAKYQSTSVSECNFDKPAYFLAIGFIRFSKKV